MLNQGAEMTEERQSPCEGLLVSVTGLAGSSVSGLARPLHEGGAQLYVFPPTFAEASTLAARN